MKTVLVTGGAGFIGSHIARELITAGHRVIILDDLSGGFRGNLPNLPYEAEFWEASICDDYGVNEIIRDRKVDTIIHAAAYAAEGLSPHIRRFNYENNLIGSVNLINAAVNFNVKTFVFLSSIAVYGDLHPPFSEEVTPCPVDPYGISKYAVEMDLKAAHQLFGLNYVIFRPHNVYGERQNLGDPYRNVVGIFMNQVLQKKAMTIFGDGSQTRAFSYISDVAPAIAASIDRPDCWNQTFNIGGAQPHQVLTLAREVAKAFMTLAEISHLPPRHEVKHAHCDHALARFYFGDLMKDVPLSEGIKAMAFWAAQVGPRNGSRFGSIEIARNLPPSWAALT